MNSTIVPPATSILIGFLALTLWGGEIRLEVTDANTHVPIAARIYVREMTSGQHHFVRSLGPKEAVIYEKQNWANLNSIEYHTSVPPGPSTVECLGPGTYQVTVERGKEYFPFTHQVVIEDQSTVVDLSIHLKRWINMQDRGWYSGETHLHRPLHELPVVMQTEDLNVAMPLTYWVTQAYTPPTQGNKNQEGEIGDRLIEVDATHVIWPRNTEYEIFTVNEHRHTLGALFILNHRSVLDLGVPTWKPVADRARDEGALMDMDKLDWPFAMTLPHSTGATLYELANNHLWRTEFGLTEWNSVAPGFMQPPEGGKSGNEQDWLAYTLGQYYVLLNAGFPLVPTAGTASGVHPVPAGFSRVYVPIEGPFSYDRWLDGLREGRSFVTTGPMMFLKVNQEHAGSTLVGPSAKCRGEILSESPLKTLEVVYNGRLISAQQINHSPTELGAFRTMVDFDVPLDQSGWICVRCTEDRPDGRLRFGHTAPWKVDVPGQPLRLRAIEKNYLVQRVRDELVRSTPILPEAALQEYRSALRHFESLPIRPD